MDTTRFEQICTSIEYGGIPTLSGCEFTKEQASKIKELLTNRSKKSLHAITLVNIKSEAKLTPKQNPE